MRKLFTIAIMALIAFSCSKETDPQGIAINEGTKSVQISVKRIISRAIDSPVVAGAITEVDDAAIFFYDATGAKVFEYIFVAGDITAIQTATSSPVEIVVKGVPTSATQAFVLSNYIVSGAGTSYSPFATTNLSATEATLVGIATQASGADNGVQKVIMSGVSSAFTPNGTDPVTAAQIVTANVSITPIVSRIEVSSIAAKDPEAGKPTITAYKLEGVFVSNYYASGAIYQGVGSGTPLRPTTDKYTAGQYLPALCDLNEAAGLPALPTGKVYAYHTFPAATAVNVPAIVLKVSNIVYTNTEGTTGLSYDSGKVKYVTISKYYDSAAKTTQITSFVPANVYKVAAIKFGVEDLGDNPFEESKIVEVELTINPWTESTIYPGI